MTDARKVTRPVTVRDLMISFCLHTENPKVPEGFKSTGILTDTNCADQLDKDQYPQLRNIQEEPMTALAGD